MRRVDEAIRQVIGDALAGELKDPRVGFVTVTDVRTSADLRHARVYVSVLAAPAPSPASSPASSPARSAKQPGVGQAEPDPRDSSLEGLRSARGFLQARIAAELRLKRTPALEFQYDDTTDRAMRLDALIEEIERS
jgi:ribosome-binding factor A